MLTLTEKNMQRLDDAQRAIEDWATESYNPETDLSPATKLDLWKIAMAVDEIIRVLILSSIVEK